MFKLIRRIIRLAILIVVAYLIYVNFDTIKGFFQKNDNKEVQMQEYKISSEISELDISLKAANLQIKNGKKFKIETNSKYISINFDDDLVEISEQEHGWLSVDTKAKLILTMPEESVLEKITISGGVGKIDVDSLKGNKLKLNLDAGKLECKNLEIYEKAEINGGSGDTKILGGNLNDLSLTLDVGKMTLKSSLTGSSNISCGVGGSDITLVGIKDDYKIKVKKAIGTFKISGNSVKDGDTYGNGKNILTINGGIGSINIDFLETIPV